jgi:hypothetical protein
MAPIPQQIPELTPLCELARKHQTDKGGWHLVYGGCSSDTCHNYTPTYYKLLWDRQGDTKKVLEIGVNAGSSLRMWEEFFPNAMIYGLDIRQEVLFNQGRIRCAYADQSNPASLLSAVHTLGDGPFDLIIDDGSHDFGHQVVSAKTLLPMLVRGGMYIIEDIDLDCQPSLLTQHITFPEYLGISYRSYDAGIGIGKAHCNPQCPACHGHEGERLIVYTRT